jgi:MFS family permease
MDHEVTTVEKMRGLRWVVSFSVLNSVNAQYYFFGSVFVLFLSELGLGKSQIGGLLSLVPFFGSIALFVAEPIARFGYKRTFVGTYGLRVFISGLLLFTPWMLDTWGKEVTLAFIVATVAGFSIARAVGVTAWYPWEQEYVPAGVRGKLSAIRSSLANFAGFLAVTVAGVVIGKSAGIGPFMTLFAAGLVFGFAGVWVMSHVPGGKPVAADPADRSFRRQMMAVLRDRNFVRFLVGGALVLLATTPLTSFLPLFMKEQVGLSAGNVVLLQNGTLVGGVLSSYLWGWAADRYGSKPVMLFGVYLMGALPILWLLMPRNSPYSLYLALAVALLQGLVNTSWNIGAARLLFVSVVPAAKRSEYLAIYYAWIGIIGGISQLLGGWLLDLFAGLSGRWLFLTIDPYFPLFVISLVLPLASIWLFRPVRADGEVSTGEFAGMFLRGNPLLAMGSLIGFHRARGERATVSMTERLGQAKSPLTVDELLEALGDPRFFVRFEAIVSISRSTNDPQLTDALIRVLEGHEPALSVIAAWALGRIGDERAVAALRTGLQAPYRSVRGHCARSLGTLGDQEVRAQLVAGLRAEPDTGLRIAYAAALGKLGAREAIGEILSLLAESHDEGARMELALAAARLLGDEHSFVQSLRQAQSDPGTAIAQALGSLDAELDDQPAAMLAEAADAFAHDELDHGVSLLLELFEILDRPDPERIDSLVLDHCVANLQQHGVQRIEYLVLALQAFAGLLG